MKATWTRLEDGSWGVRVESNLGAVFQAIVGQEVDVERRDGVVSKQLVTRVVKVLEPQPAKRVRVGGGGFRTIAAVTAYTAICEVEPREKLPTARKPRRARTSQEAREMARQEWRDRPMPRQGMVNVDAVGFETEDAPASSEPAQGAVSFADLLSKPARLSPESTLTRA